MTNAPGKALSATARSREARIESYIDASRARFNGTIEPTTNNDGSRR
jgi:hypothetical protein